MNVISHTMLPRHLDEGRCTRTVADAVLCGSPFQVETACIEAGTATAGAVHPQLRVVVVLAGSGKLILDAGPLRFSAPCTLRLPAGAPHRFINDTAVAMQLVTVYMPTPGPESAQP